MNKKFLGVVLAVLVLAALGAAGYFLIIKNSDSEDSAVADWKIYRSEQYGFEFKYPSGWTLDDLDSANSVMVISSGDLAEKKRLPDLSAGFIVSYEEKFSDFGAETVEELFEKFLSESKDSDRRLKVFDPAIIQFNQNKAVSVATSAFDSEYSMYVYHNNHGYRLSFGGKSNVSELTDIEKEILSTFRFTE